VEFEEDLITWVCLELNARALVSSWKVENLDDLNVETSRLVEAVCRMVHRTVRCTPDSVRCASHVTRPLGSDRWSSDCWARLDVRWRTGHAL
jgi:hypothetical protein